MQPLPCPFCGQQSFVYKTHTGHYGVHCVAQQVDSDKKGFFECHVSTLGPHGDTREEAIAKWNKRSSLTPVKTESPIAATIHEALKNQLKIAVSNVSVSDIELHETALAEVYIQMLLYGHGNGSLFNTDNQSFAKALAKATMKYVKEVKGDK